MPSVRAASSWLSRPAASSASASKVCGTHRSSVASIRSVSDSCSSASARAQSPRCGGEATEDLLGRGDPASECRCARAIASASLARAARLQARLRRAGRRRGKPLRRLARQPWSIPVDIACSRVARAPASSPTAACASASQVRPHARAEACTGGERSGVRRLHALRARPRRLHVQARDGRRRPCANTSVVGSPAARANASARSVYVGQQRAVGRRPWSAGAVNPVPGLQLQVAVRLAERQRLARAAARPHRTRRRKLWTAARLMVAMISVQSSPQARASSHARSLIGRLPTGSRNIWIRADRHQGSRQRGLIADRFGHVLRLLQDRRAPRRTSGVQRKVAAAPQRVRSQRRRASDRGFQRSREAALGRRRTGRAPSTRTSGPRTGAGRARRLFARRGPARRRGWGLRCRARSSHSCWPGRAARARSARPARASRRGGGRACRRPRRPRSAARARTGERSPAAGSARPPPCSSATTSDLSTSEASRSRIAMRSRHSSAAGRLGRNRA